MLVERRRRRCGLIVWGAACCAVVAPAAAWAQPSVSDGGKSRPVQASGASRDPSRSSVQTTDAQGKPVVARRYATRGGRHFVFLPSGEIVERSADQLEPADRPFRPATAKKLGAELARRFPDLELRVSGSYVFLSNTSELFSQVTRRVLVTMLPGIRKHARKWKLQTHPPEFPLVVLMFRTRRQFDAYRKMPAEVLAYYDPWTNYIVLHEESPLYRVNRDMAIRQMISTIAHEGAHQILHNIGIQQRLSRWPMWMGEGLAEYLAPTKLGRRMSWKGAGMVNDLRMLELEFYIKAKAFDSTPGEMIAHTVQGSRLTSTGYAAAWALTHYLAGEHKSAFRSLLKELTAIGPYQAVGRPDERGMVVDQLGQFRRHLSLPLPEVEQDLIEYLEKLPYTDPFAMAPHFVALVRLQRGEKTGWKANIFHTQAQAERWSAQFVRQLEDGIRHQVEIVSVPSRPAAHRLIREYSRRRP